MPFFYSYTDRGGRTRKGRKVRWTFLVRARPRRAQDGRPGRAAPPYAPPRNKGTARKCRFFIPMGYTQAFVSEFSGFSISFISDLENGKSSAELGKAIYLANLLGLDCSLTPRSDLPTISSARPYTSRALGIWHFPSVVLYPSMRSTGTLFG